MRIERVARYIIGGQEFQTRKAAEDWLFDRIGETLDRQLAKGKRIIGPGDRLAMVQAIVECAPDLAPMLAALATPTHDEDAF